MPPSGGVRPMERDTINVKDPVTGEAVDVPAHPEADAIPVKQFVNLPPKRAKHEYGELDELPGESLPVRLEQDFRADPVEGEHGTFKEIVELEDNCPACGYDRGRAIVQTISGTHMLVCNACETTIESA